MLKKFATYKNIAQKTKQVGVDGLEKIERISQKESLLNVKEKLNDAVIMTFDSAKKESKEFFYNDESLIKAADKIYGKTIPPPIKLLLRKKRFLKIVLRVRDKCMENSCLKPDQCSNEVVKEYLD